MAPPNFVVIITGGVAFIIAVLQREKVVGISFTSSKQEGFACCLKVIFIY